MPIEITNIPEVSLVEIVKTGVNWQFWSFVSNVFMGAATLVLAAIAFWAIMKDGPKLKFFIEPTIERVDFTGTQRLGLIINLTNDGPNPVTLLLWFAKTKTGILPQKDEDLRQPHMPDVALRQKIYVSGDSKSIKYVAEEGENIRDIRRFVFVDSTGKYWRTPRGMVKKALKGVEEPA